MCTVFGINFSILKRVLQHVSSQCLKQNQKSEVFYGQHLIYNTTYKMMALYILLKQLLL
jgi:hypothetical protein